MAFIYLITNQVNGKVYVGQTVQTVESRWKQHINSSKRKDYPLYYAMRKYGIENFKVETLEEVAREKLNSREMYWIAYYNSFGHNGYNATLGGERGSTLIFTDSQYDDIKNMYLGGNTIKTIAEKLSVDHQTVSKILKSLGVKFRRQPFNINSFEKQRVIDEYNNGSSLDYIAKEFSTDRETVKRTLIKWGVDLRKRCSFFDNPKLVKDMINDFMSGITYKSLELKYHTDTRKIKEILTKNNIDFKKVRFKGLLSETQVINLIKEYNLNKYSLRDIAKKYQINVTTVYSILEYMNIDYRRYNITKSAQISKSN